MTKIQNTKLKINPNANEGKFSELMISLYLYSLYNPAEINAGTAKKKENSMEDR